MITITKFDSLWDITPKTEILNWEEAVKYFCPTAPEIVSKEARSKRFSLNTYKEGTMRAKNNVEAMTGIVFDFDNTNQNDNPIDNFVPITSIVERFNTEIYFWYTTYHNRASHPRWRLVLPFEHPLPIQDWNDAYEGALRLLGNVPGLDKASKDRTHMWLHPYKNPDEPFEAGYNQDGKFLNAQTLCELSRLHRKVNPSIRQTMLSKNLSPISSSEVREKIETIDPDCDYQTWIKIGMALNHHFNGTTEGLSTWATWSQRSPKYPGYDVLERHWNSFGGHTTPITIGSIMHMARNKGYIGNSYNSKSTIKNNNNSNYDLPTKDKKHLTISAINTFRKKTFPPLEMLLDPIIPTQGLTLLHAPRGIGKTFLSLWISYVVGIGKGMFNDRWSATSQKKVLFIDGEMSAATLQNRLEMCAQILGEIEDENFFQILTGDEQDRSLPDLSTVEGQAELEPHLEGIKLLVLDNLSTLLRTGDENEASSWKVVQEWLLSLRKRGISVLLIHHSNKKGSQRGTSKREDVMDTIIVLKRPKDYETEQGARFEVHYEKTRGFHGDKAKPFEAWLKDGVWEINECLEKMEGTFVKEKRTDDLSRFAPVIALAKQGFKPEQIAEHLQCHRSTVYRVLKQAKELNLYATTAET